MPITASNIKLLASERMSDATDGGGRMTSTEIVSGQMNNIFPKVSRTDAVYGRVNLRKIYAAVQSATLDMYGGAHAIVADAPDDERINCALFSTGSAFDTRAEARNRIESYVVAAGLSRMRIYGNQIAGAKAVTVYQREEEPLPESGDVLCLSVEASGYTAATQYVRITDIEHEVRTFNDSTVEFKRRVIILSLASPLVQNFPGVEPLRGTDNSPTKVRSTVVADASKYYGIQPVTATVAANALECSVASVYGALVPSTNRESPISNAEIGGALMMKEAGADISGVTLLTMPLSGGAVSYTMPTGVMPGTWRNSGNTYADDGNGNLIKVSNGALGGSIDYATGTVSFLASAQVTGGQATGTRSPYYTPAVQVSQPSHTRAIPVTLATRGTVYVETLTPLPGKGAVVVDYRALGRWYRLRDNGQGELKADSPSIGVGTIDYVTGAVVVTLGALPDIDSSVIFSWGSSIHTDRRTGAQEETGGYFFYRFQIPDEHLPIKPDTTVTMTGTLNNSAAVTFNVASNASAITASGQAQFSGTLDRNTGLVEIRHAAGSATQTLKFNSTLTASYTTLTDGGDSVYETAADVLVSNAATLGGDIRPGSIEGLTPWIVSPFNNPIGEGVALFRDDGAGNLFIPAGTSLFGRRQPQIAIGTIDYATGAATFLSGISLSSYTYDFAAGSNGDADGAWIESQHATSFVPNSPVSIRYSGDPVASQAVSNSTVFDVTRCHLKCNRTSGHPLMPRSILFRLCAKFYFDNNGALAYGDGASSTPAGTIDYATGEAAIEWWQDTYTANFALFACVTRRAAEHTGQTFKFRTAGSPLRVASLYVQAHTPGGTLIAGTTDTNGYITGGNIVAGEISRVNQQMGVVSVQFGQPVLPSTIRYNTVVLTNLPLDPTLLGLDPVRLPMDGRVPIYRPGDIVVLHHTDTTTLPNPVTPGNTYSLGRTDLASVSLADSLGAPVLDAEWSADLEDGTVTIDAGATLTGLTQPLIATHRIEQMTLATDVQVSGLVGFSAPVPREFPAGSLLSSALMFGDLVARVSNVFDQATWTSVWSDTLIGSQATAQYNDIAYPIQVLNNGAITERWRISFTSATAFAVIGENVGQIATGTTSGNVSVGNPLTGEPYFTLLAAGWGSGWATGNQLRFNTHGANAPIWIARTILGGATLDGDAFTVEMRGDTD